MRELEREGIHVVNWRVCSRESIFISKRGISFEFVSSFRD